MTEQSKITAAEQPFETAFAAVPEREQLQLFRRLASKLHSGSAGYDLIMDGINQMAFDLADWDDWRGDDLAARYLDDSSIPPAYQRCVMVTLAPVVRMSERSVIA